MACCSDIAGLVRGKAFPLRDLERRLETGVGWCPTNTQITAFNNIAETPFGPFGDTLLMPDPAAQVEVDYGDDQTAERFVLADVTETDGTPWACCLRTLLKNALAALEADAGLAVRASFEHEFHYADLRPPGGGGYGLRSFRAAAPGRSPDRESGECSRPDTGKRRDRPRPAGRARERH
jgi:glutamine synthetase